MKLQDIVKLNQSFEFDYLSQDRELAQQVQIRLVDLKLLSGVADGAYGPITRQATVKFAQAFDLPELLNAVFAEKLIEAKEVPNTIVLIPTSLPICGVELIKRFEGCFLNAYPDPLTKREPITIGWGSTKKRDGSPWRLGESISQQEADELLILQLERNYLPDLAKIPCWGELNPNQQGALLSFGYNLGSKFYGAPGFDSMTKVLKNRDWDKIRETFIKYRNPGTNVEKGLLARRQAEAELFLTPII
ncbi:glycoside hydrolase family protein [Scytonema sp. UIC 10036]|uniref:glycoside hydrolase family protein n=1 Tax=Scytonema sp. UIC 10036 TaxID=2304196 RepID=UPI0012DA4BBF|nr:glycoside hydrolase family protein [Scytonema sp. UIC 10036]MUG91325.1 glycoside hydrolase family protein [Scytonema sp. UIC 10036]